MHQSPSYAAALSAKAPKAAKKTLDHIRVSEAESGGHIAEHHFESSGSGSYHEPETHVFGKEEGHKLMAHIAEHLGIKLGGKTHDAEQLEDEHEA